jgi:nicotinamidase-related amidase
VQYGRQPAFFLIMPTSALPPLPKCSCLFVVDPQVQFSNDHSAHIRPGIEALIPRYEYLIVSRLVPDPGGPIERFKRWRPARPGAPGFEFCINWKPLPPGRELLVEKTLFSAFGGHVRSWVMDRGINEIHVVGGDTDLCVLRTAADIMEAGIRPVVIGSLCASYAGEPLHSHALIQMKRMLGKAQVW